MFFNIFGNAKPPPLTASCSKLSVPENLFKMADGMTASSSSKVDKRAVVLELVVMGAAGHFVEGLRWERNGMWEGSRRYLRNTNLDVITAEAIVWIQFLMGRFWQADQKKDRDMFEQVGYGTLGVASRLELDMIEEHTGFDFNSKGAERRKSYLEALKDSSVSYEPFATTVLRSVGCRSLAEPLKAVGPLPPPEWTPLALNVSIFFSTMPAGFYETFKNFLRGWPDRFPRDEEFEDQ